MNTQAQTITTEKPPIERRSWRIPEFAERHGVSQALLYKEMRSGRLQSRKIGAATIISAEHEAAWLAALDAEASGDERTAA